MTSRRPHRSVFPSTPESSLGARCRRSLLAAALLATCAASSRAQTVIDFESLTTAPCSFNLTTALGEQLAPFGVHFSGPTTVDGGAVLDQCGNFFLGPRSGVKFLTFNLNSISFTNGGHPIDPENVSFDSRVFQLEIWCASISPATCQIDAYDGNVLVGSNSISTVSAWTPLSIAVAGGFTRVVLDSNGASVFIYDDLSFTTGPSTIGTPYCLGDGSGTACPCGNNSPVGAMVGCLSSLGIGGKLGATGTASIATDTLTLLGSQMPNGPVLYFQGTTQTNGGLGTVFGDGLRCASGTIIRMKTTANVAGASQFPAAGDPSVSVRGLVTMPGIRTYQAWYRNAADFCTPATFNLTNGVQLNWVP
jgi:hypothetical protein